MRISVEGRIGRRWSPLLAGVSVVAMLGLLASCDSTPVVLSGVVSAAPSGAGVGGVSVSVYADDSETLVAQTTTDAVGGYVLRASTLADAFYRVRVGGAWWPDAESWVDAASVDLSASAPTTIDHSLAEVGSLTGAVVDGQGSPIDSDLAIAMRVDDGTTVGVAPTDGDGVFRIPLVEVGTYRVLLDDPASPEPPVFIGGATPVDFEVVGGDVAVGMVDPSTGLVSPAPSGTTTRVSVASDGTQGERSSIYPSISADGRFVAFESSAANLVAGDTNNRGDVFVHDRSTGVTSRVSIASDGSQADNSSYEASISADGRFVAFWSHGTNLVPGDTNGQHDVFVHDRSTGVTSRVSVASDGAQAGNRSQAPAISADGRFIAFQSYAANLVVGDTNNRLDVFVHDQSTGVTSLVSVASDGTRGNNESTTPSISADGSLIAFRSDAANLVAGDTNAQPDVFVHDRSTGATSRVSVASAGTQASGGSTGPAISQDGQYVTFTSYAPNLVAGDTNAKPDVFAYDRITGFISAVSVASDGSLVGGFGPQSISADGRHIPFTSTASNLVPGDTNGMSDVFVRDRITGITSLVAVASDGTQADRGALRPSISADGHSTAFYSTATNLVAGDTNTYDPDPLDDFPPELVDDVFVHDR